MAGRGGGGGRQATPLPAKYANNAAFAAAFRFFDRVLPSHPGFKRMLVRGGFCWAILGLGWMVGQSYKLERVGSENDFLRLGLKEVDRMNTFSDIAGTYDDTIGREEFWMGLVLFRRWIMKSHATGDVLEVGAGTGRNVKYYTKATSVTYTDQSQSMLDTLSAKLPEAKDGGVVHKTQQASTAALPFESRTFDTVVSTFGLCSYENPVKALHEMQRVCKLDGTIILLEHGVGWYGWINRRLAAGAETHARHYGCVWNKPIHTLVEEAGLDIQYTKRWHFGTTYYYLAKPKQNLQPRKKGARGVFSSA